MTPQGWVRGAVDGARDYGHYFYRRKILRRLSEEAAKLLGEFTPSGLERFIASGLSIVDRLAKGVPPEEQRRYARKAQDYREIAATISDADILAELEKRIPEHVLVLRRHPTWFGAELARIRFTLFPPAAPRGGALPAPPARFIDLKATRPGGALSPTKGGDA